MNVPVLQRAAAAALEEEMRDGRRAVLIDGIVSKLVAVYGEAHRKEVIAIVVHLVKQRGAAAFWTEPST